MGSIFKIVLFLICVWIVNSCDLYKPEEIIQDGFEKIDFDCFSGTSEYYFRSKFGEDSICGYDGENGYVSVFGTGNGFITLSESFSYEDLQTQDSKSFIELGLYRDSDEDEFIEAIRILSQPVDFGTPLDSMVKSFLVNGVHPVRGKLENGQISKIGFEVILDRWYENPSLNPNDWMISFTSALGNQPIESYVSINEIYLSRKGEYMEGHISLDFNCKMYHWNAGELTGRFGRDLSGEIRVPIKYKL